MRDLFCYLLKVRVVWLLRLLISGGMITLVVGLYKIFGDFNDDHGLIFFFILDAYVVILLGILLCLSFKVSPKEKDETMRDLFN